MQKESLPENQHNKQDQNEQKPRNNKPKRQNANKNNPRNPRKPRQYHNPNFNLNPKTLQHFLFFKPSRSEIEDLNTYIYQQRDRKRILHVMHEFMKKDRKNLDDTAKYCHEILYELGTRDPEIGVRITYSFLSCLMEVLGQYKKDIEGLLDKRQGEKLVDKLPLEYIVQVIQLYSVKLSQKHTASLLHEMSLTKSITRIPQLLATQSSHNYNLERQLVPVIKQLIREKNWGTLRKIPNIEGIMRNNVELQGEKSQMMFLSARYQCKTNGWEALEQIFEEFPEVIAKIINTNRKMHTEKTTASICHRNPSIFKFLFPSARTTITHQQQQIQDEKQEYILNSLRINKFQPSSEEYFGLGEFGIQREDVVWIDDGIDRGKLEKITEEILEGIRDGGMAGIDTESVIARTPLEEDKDVLALIQLAVGGKVYLIDTLHCPHKQIKILFTSLLLNKHTVIIGHTIDDDISTIRTYLQISQSPSCSIIDIKTQYQKIRNTRKELSLKSISKAILGKEICKKYCMTNWARRPLNLCQIHYAAMDAVVVRSIWEKLVVERDQKEKQKEKQEKDTLLLKEKSKSQGQVKREEEDVVLRVQIPV